MRDDPSEHLDPTFTQDEHDEQATGRTIFTRRPVAPTDDRGAAMATNKQIKQGFFSECDVCQNKNGIRWEHGTRKYCSVGCAIWDGWNPMDGFEVHPHETREADEARAIHPVKAVMYGGSSRAERPDWNDPYDGITLPRTKA